MCDNYELICKLESELLKVRAELQAVKSDVAIIKNANSISKLEPFLSMKDVCRMLSVTPPTVYKRIADGDIKIKRMGCRVYFDRAEIEANMLVKTLG